MAQEQSTVPVGISELLTEDEVKALEALAVTFRWNLRSALSNLITMEDHYLELAEEDIPHAWCLVKHYLLALDHHVKEAISHSERLGLDPTPYRQYRRKLLELNAYPQPAFTLPELLELRTEWREIISDPTLVEDCPLCAADVSIKLKRKRAKKKGNKHTPPVRPLGREILKLEVEYANKLHDTIAQHKGEKAAPFTITMCQGDPTGRAVATVNKHGDPFVNYCAGGVNAHVALHEDNHYRRHNDGECDLKKGDCPEDTAEQFALNELSISQTLNTHPWGGGSEKKMALGKYEVIGIYGASVVAKGVEYGLMQLDGMFTPNAIKVWERASFWGHVLLGLVPPLLIFMGRKRTTRFGKLDLPIMVASAHITSNLLEYVQELMTPGEVTARRLAYNRRRPPIPRAAGAGRVYAF